EQWTLTSSDAVLTVSTKLREHVLSLGAKPSRVHVFPNGVNPEIFKPAPRDENLRRQFGLGDGPVLGFIGNLRPWHGVQIFPRLLEKLVKKSPSLQLVIAGEGPLRSQLKTEFKKRNLLKHVVFTGLLPHEQMPALIRQFDIALAPYSKPEHDFYFSPLKIFEYMACGVAVVCADLGQISEIVKPGKTGLLYKPGDLGELAAACLRLLAEPKLRARLGQAGSKEIHAKFTWDQNAKRAANLASKLIAERAKSKKTSA
ncbi:MAG: glycosyltransferase family 4 protein, partial [Verrucomicrobiota bacterium]